MVEVHEAKERSDIFDFLGSWPACNPIQLDGVHGKLSGFHNHTEVFYFGGGEATFLQFEVEVQFCHLLENTSGTFAVCFLVQGEYEEVIHVDDEPSFSDHVTEGVIHEALECGGRVGETEEHGCGFEKTFVGDKGSFPLVTVFDLNIVVAPLDVELGK